MKNAESFKISAVALSMVMSSAGCGEMEEGMDPAWLEPSPDAANAALIPRIVFYDKGVVKIGGSPTGGKKVRIKNHFCHQADNSELPCSLIDEWGDWRYGWTAANGSYKIRQGTDNGCKITETVRQVLHRGKWMPCPAVHRKFPAFTGDITLNINLANGWNGCQPPPPPTCPPGQKACEPGVCRPLHLPCP